MNDPRDMGPSGKPLFDGSSRGVPRIDEGDAGDEEATVMREIPEDLLAEASAGDGRSTPAGGAIFSNNAAPIRGALPTEEEGDALLDQLLQDPGLTPVPEPSASPRSVPPPLPPSALPKIDETLPEAGHFEPIGGDDEESVDEPTRMLSALSFEEQDRVELDLHGHKLAASAREDGSSTPPGSEPAPGADADEQALAHGEDEVAFTSDPPAPLDEESTHQVEERVATIRLTQNSQT
jgi:hypothetical protein